MNSSTVSIGYSIGVRTECKPSKEKNEDSYFITQTPEGILVASIFDGMGGTAGGYEASNISKTQFEAELSTVKPNMSEDDILRKYKKATFDAHMKIKGKDFDYTAGTTAVSGIMMPDRRVYVLSIGDSRAYKISTTNKQVLTIDDSLFGASAKGFPEEPTEENRTPVMIMLYEDDIAKYLKKTEQEFLSSVRTKEELEQAEFGKQVAWNFRNPVYNYISANYSPSMTTTITTIEPGTYLLLNSDGLENLTDAEIFKIFEKHSEPQEIADGLVNAATDVMNQGKTVNFRSKKDDITVIVVKATEKK